MFRKPSALARFTADLLLRGPFEEVAVAAALAKWRGRRTKTIDKIAQRLVLAIGAGKRPRIGEVAACLDGIAGFERLMAAMPAPDFLQPPPTMQPAAGPSRSWQLPAIPTLSELARWLRVEQDTMEWLRAAWRRTRHSHHHYNHQWIPRRHSAPRLIEAPKLELMAVQQRIYTGLLTRIPAHDAAHGFVRGRSTASFVAPHCNRQGVLRMDLRDFFPSIGRPRVTRTFLNAGYPEDVATALADLCTTQTPRHVGERALSRVETKLTEPLRIRLQRPHLPQGAPTSPALANLAAFALDSRLQGLARRFAANYTRYADDLLFSGGATFARQAHRCEVYVAAIALECGLEIAHRKTRIMHASARQCAAGLVMNAHPALPRRKRELLEAIITNCMRHGPAGQNRSGHRDFRTHLRGRIADLMHVNPAHGAKLLTRFLSIDWQD